MIDPFDFMDWLMTGQWRIKVTGESGYDWQFWEVVIKDPLHIYEIRHLEERRDILLKQVLRDAIAKLSKTRNGHSALYSYRKQFKLNTDNVVESYQKDD